MLLEVLVCYLNFFFYLFFLFKANFFISTLKYSSVANRPE